MRVLHTLRLFAITMAGVSAPPLGRFRGPQHSGRAPSAQPLSMLWWTSTWRGRRRFCPEAEYYSYFHQLLSIILPQFMYIYFYRKMNKPGARGV